jgi:uncharacterized cupin superfamily protein
VDVFNLHDDDWDRSEDREGWRSKDAWVGKRIGAELIGGSMYELEPGDRLWPYHVHHANEEWLIVVRGTPTRVTSSASVGVPTVRTRSGTGRPSRFAC